MKLSLSFKQKIFSECIKHLDEKIKSLKTILHDLTEGSGNDAKSSAGDKHETAMAMMQIEHENISRQLSEALNEKNEFVRIELGEKSHATLGSVIKTNRGYFFIGIGLGKITVESIPVIVLSTQSPMVKMLLGLKTGDSIAMNGEQYVMEEIL